MFSACEPKARAVSRHKVNNLDRTFRENSQCSVLHDLVWSDNVGMRRWMFMAALGAALLATPLWAQRGGRGGMAMGGARGGSVGGVHGGTGFVGGAPRPGWAGGVHGGFVHGPHPGHFPYYGWRYPWWGYRGYYGYGGWGYPSWGWYGGAGYSSGYYPSGYSSSGWYSDPATQYPVYVYANPDNTNNGYNQQQEIDRLNNEVAQLRAEQQSGALQNYAQPSGPKAEIHGDTVLVFRDRHIEEIQNYAIVGKTLWVFTEQRARRIPIAELNVPATTKANEARGIDFQLPGQ